jgi:hypothetical protein
VLDDRVGTRATLITSQLPVKAWHAYLDDPTLAFIASPSGKQPRRGERARYRERPERHAGKWLKQHGRPHAVRRLDCAAHGARREVSAR